MEFRLSRPADHEQIYKLMEKAFRAPPSSVLRNETLQGWKYWEQHPDWDGPRSYVLMEGDQLVSHGAVWPMRLQSSDGKQWTGIYLIDWVSNPALVPGSGVVLLRRVAGLGDGIFAIGGSSDTRAIMPKIGFREYNEAGFYARPLRPTRQALTHPRKNWKLPLRWSRNVYWQLKDPVRRQILGWESEATSPSSIPPELMPRAVAAGLMPNPEEWVIPVRSAELFSYWEQSPWARFRFFLVKRQSRAVGYFCLSIAQGQARLADIWVQSGDIEDWHAAYGLALGRAAEEPGAVEMIAMGSSPLAHEVLIGAGFHLMESLPITVFGRGDLCQQGRSFLLQMADADFAFLHEGRRDYWV